MTEVVLCTPLRVEQAALRGATHPLRPLRTGMGPRRAATTATRLPPTTPILIAGVAAAQSPHIRPGDIVIATEVRTASRATARSLPNSGSAEREAGSSGGVESPSAVLLAGALRGLGLRVHLGAISSIPRIARGALGDGSIAVDMESAWLAGENRPFAVVRAVVDTPDLPLWRPGTLWRGISALRALRACRPALEWWAAATGPREVLLATPDTAHAIAGQVQMVLVAGSASSSHLVAVTRRRGVPAYPVGEVGEIDLRWLAGRVRLGLVADTSAPPQLAGEIVRCLGGLGTVTTSEALAPREVS